MVKRRFDILFSALALLLLAPVFVFVALLSLRKLGSPVIFTQERPGLDGRPFQMFKFRTMTDNRSAEGVLLPDTDRLTAFGIWLRATSLDELPELWNVLKGEMSMVGPRPLLMEYLPLYSAEQARRNELKPGITGWAQVNGRNAISWDEKFRLDIWYLENQSTSLDLKIILLTVLIILRRDGINSNETETMPKFTGSLGKKRNG